MKSIPQRMKEDLVRMHQEADNITAQKAFARADARSINWIDALMGTVEWRMSWYKAYYGKKSDFYLAAKACYLDMKLVRAHMESASNGADERPAPARKD